MYDNFSLYGRPRARLQDLEVRRTEFLERLHSNGGQNTNVQKIDRRWVKSSVEI